MSAHFRFKRLLGLALVIVSVLAMVTPATTMAGAPLPRMLRIPILMYHYVSPPPANANQKLIDLWVLPKNFRCQLQWLKDNGYTTITPDEMAQAVYDSTKSLPPKPILLTFDDGYADAYYNVFPMLKEFGFTGTFFVITSYLDEGRRDYLNWAEAKAMADAGMSIESHSAHHYEMRGLDKQHLQEEVFGSLTDIEKETGIKPHFFCYPSGHYDINVIRTLIAAGVTGAFTTSDGLTVSPWNMLRLPRIRVRGTTTLAEFKYLVTRNLSEKTRSSDLTC
jgi:peptidoglycan/xylan/chitin deacetylase (PgdA/CDA1 family)